jgi:hypothetical protein
MVKISGDCVAVGVTVTKDGAPGTGGPALEFSSAGVKPVLVGAAEISRLAVN